MNVEPHQIRNENFAACRVSVASSEVAGSTTLASGFRFNDMKFQFNDGGRAASGLTTKPKRDCCARAIAIAAEIPYDKACELIDQSAIGERTGTKKRGISSSQSGVYTRTFRKIMENLGWKWTPTMQIGSGCKVHLRSDELPMGRIICNVSRHYVAVIDGVINDVADCSREGTRCVYGYFSKP